MNPTKIIGALTGILLLFGLAYHQVRDKSPLDAEDPLLIGTALDQQADPRDEAPTTVQAEEKPQKSADGPCVGDEEARKTGRDCEADPTSGHG